MHQPTLLVHDVLLVAGGDDAHQEAGKALSAALENTGRFNVSLVSVTKNGVPALANLPGSDFKAVLLAVNVQDKLPPDQAKGLTQFVEGGSGLVALAQAARSFRGNNELVAMMSVGVDAEAPSAFDFQVRPAPAALDAGDPIVVRTDPFAMHDRPLRILAPEDAQVFAVGHVGADDTPLGYTRRVGEGTIVYFACGATAEGVANRYLQRMIERALRVVAGESFDAQVAVGIIGYGGAFNMGKLHADAINAQRGLQTVAVCDLDPARTDQARAELGEHIRTHQDIDELLAEDDIGMVVMILPHHLHARACIAASRAGRHVVTEKPFCITLDEADRMIAAADEAGTMLSCFHNRRWDGDFRQMLTCVRRGDIGEVFHADAASGSYKMPPAWWRADKRISGGVLYDWGAHYADWLLNLIPQRIESVSGSLQKRYWHQSTNEDYALVNIRFVDGTTATLEQGDLVAIKRAGWRILGTRGGLSNAGPGAEVTLVQHVAGTRREAVLDKGKADWLAYYQNIANHLIMGERLVVTAEQARRVIGIFDLAEQSHARGGAPLPLPGEDRYEPDYLWPW